MSYPEELVERKLNELIREHEARTKARNTAKDSLDMTDKNLYDMETRILELDTALQTLRSISCKKS